jgi:glycerol-3-phosphate dehydrogenase
LHATVTAVDLIMPLQEVVRDATVLVICTPHQFVYGICKQLRGKVDKSAIAVSLTKVSHTSSKCADSGMSLANAVLSRELNDNKVATGSKFFFCKQIQSQNDDLAGDFY